MPRQAEEPWLTLAGPWEVAQYDGPGLDAEDDWRPALDGLDWIPADVPGSVHYDLMRAGRLRNPFASSADAAAALWVTRSGWLYRTSFDLSSQSFPPASVSSPVPGAFALRVEGIDTYSDIWLNGTRLGSTANALRSYELPIERALLFESGNELLVHVKSHHRAIEGRMDEASRRLRVQDRSDERLTKGLIRRYQRNMHAGSSLLNLGVHVLGIGLYKPMAVIAVPPARLSDVHSRLASVGSGAQLAVDLTIGFGAPGGTGRLEAEITLTAPESAEVVTTAVVPVDGEHARAVLTVPDPRLWWPRGYGAQPLYGLEVRLRSGARQLDELSRRVGLRTIRLRRESESGRRTFQLEVNGQPIMARGTNFVPVDYLSVHGRPEEYERLFAMIADGNYNLVRLWGGGAVEADRFYQRCDELGILVWQDVLLHSTTYPDYDPDFVAEFRAEVGDLLRRVRNHACLGLICGGNEQWEGWEERNWSSDVDQFYGAALSRDVSRVLARQLCPEVPFVVNSPHGDPAASSPVDGDTHTWGNFFNATKDPQFVTETCWGQESYSRPATLAETMAVDVDAPVFNGQGWHREWTRITGRPVIIKFPYSSFDGKANLRQYLHHLEIEQALADYHALSMLRLRSPSCSGIVYWSLNKGGPLFGFGSVDYGGRPMMSYYVVKRLFADVVVGIYRDIGDVRVVAANGTASPVRATVELRHLHVDGRTIDERRAAPVELAPGRITRVLDLPSYAGVSDRRRELVHVALLVDGQVVSEDVLWFCPLAEVAGAEEVGLKAEARVAGHSTWEVDVEAVRPAKMIWIESDDRILADDNYFALMPGRRRRIRVRPLDAAVTPPSLTIGVLGSSDSVTARAS